MKKFEEIMTKVLPYMAAASVIAIIGVVALTFITCVAALPMVLILSAAFL